MILPGTTERRQPERAVQVEGRLPPGQKLTVKWPVLHTGSVPWFDQRAALERPVGTEDCHRVTEARSRIPASEQCGLT